jgi:hypothetical protein
MATRTRKMTDSAEDPVTTKKAKVDGSVRIIEAVSVLDLSKEVMDAKKSEAAAVVIRDAWVEADGGDVRDALDVAVKLAGKKVSAAIEFALRGQFEGGDGTEVVAAKLVKDGQEMVDKIKAKREAWVEADGEAARDTLDEAVELAKKLLDGRIVKLGDILSDKMKCGIDRAIPGGGQTAMPSLYDCGPTIETSLREVDEFFTETLCTTSLLPDAGVTTFRQFTEALTKDVMQMGGVISYLIEEIAVVAVATKSNRAAGPLLAKLIDIMVETDTSLRSLMETMATMCTKDVEITVSMMAHKPHPPAGTMGISLSDQSDFNNLIDMRKLYRSVWQAQLKMHVSTIVSSCAAEWAVFMNESNALVAAARAN